LKVWQLSGGLLTGESDDRPRPVGSLQKPFVALAWARSHPGATPPRVRCDRSSHCWRLSGHGTVGLARALAVSCNTYFRQLAAEPPPDVLASTLREEGFEVPIPLEPDAAIGLRAPEGFAAIRPSALLAAYVHLTRVPWPSGEVVRQALLEGLRDSA